MVSPSQTFTTLASFRYDGARPEYMSLIEGNDGSLYGTTLEGGGLGLGAIFEVTAAGQMTEVSDFGDSVARNPYAGLTQDAEGNFYGTTWQSAGDNKTGAVFELTGYTLTVLHYFCSQTNCADGGDPFAPLLRTINGNLYGMTLNGGAKGYGTVFEVTPTGQFTTLHSFNYKDGASPVAGLVQGADGNFYGTTLYGGAKGSGTVFEITPAGVFTTLYSFCSQTKCADGAGPYAGLIQANDGNFYGTTYGGGAHGQGTVFEITAAGNLTTLYSFCSQAACTDGSRPYAGVVQATDGNFYGVTSKGGTGNQGTLYQITIAGKLTTLHSFCLQTECTDGADPLGGLLQASSGILYGTTAEGGTYQQGTVFSISLGQGRALEAKATSGESAKFAEPASDPLPASYLGPSVPWPSGSGQAPLVRRRPAPDPSAHAPGPVNPEALTCSPAPCVLPPTQASEGGGLVTDSPIVSDPLNPRRLLLGSVDYNCAEINSSDVSFHLSTDGGSTWKMVCMAGLTQGRRGYVPDDEPSVGYDRNGTGYVAASYYETEGSENGLVAVQKSTDGIRWGKPVAALQGRGQEFPFETTMAVDASPSSPRVNSVYVSGVMWSDQGVKNQVLVSHSTDGGATWTQVSVDSAQKWPEHDDFTRLAVGGDGTVYLAWMSCRQGYDLCGYDLAHIMFSKSTDGGNTWSMPQRIATATTVPALTWKLSNTSGERAYNYPAIAVDNSNGPYAGNIYMVMYTWTGTYMRVQMIRSPDGGNSWSQPVAPAERAHTHDQFFPAISVSPKGLVGVSWLDRHNDPGDADYQAFAAISYDGGQSFGRNWQLTQAFSNPDTNGTQNNWMGDYTGNTWVGDKFIAAWMDSSNGTDMQEVVGGVQLK